MQLTVVYRRDFNPRSPHGERQAPSVSFLPGTYFNPRSPHGERQPATEPCASANIFQSTLPARGATSLIWRERRGRTFQSTLPARGATRVPRRGGRDDHISIHAPRTGSDDMIRRKEGTVMISIHAPRTGSDAVCLQKLLRVSISIHAPRTGSDRCPMIQATVVAHFNPRSPHGERQRKVTILSIRIIGFAQKVYHKTVLLRISLAENAVILPKRPQNPVRTSLQKAGGLRFARAIRAARPYSISSPSGA